MNDINNQLNLLLNKLDVLIDAINMNALNTSNGQNINNTYTAFQWFEKWLEEYHKPNVNPDTFKKDKSLFKNHIYVLGQYNLPLPQFKQEHLQCIVNSIRQSRQRQVAANFLVGALRLAYINEYMPKDITIGFKKPAHEYEYERSFLHSEEQRFLRGLNYLFLEETQSIRSVENVKVCDLMKTYLYSGVRRSEGVGLQRKFLDFDKDVILIRQQLTLKGAINPKLKTKTSYRSIKMFPELKEVLIKYKDLPLDAFLYT